MKRNDRNKRTRTIGRSVMIAALLCTGPLTFGQDGLMAANDVRSARADSAGEADASAPRPVNAPITDDGHAGDELVGTRQLVIAFREGEARPFSVDILNEQGRCVRTYAFDEASGRKAVPVSVEGLAQGRYVARVAREGQIRLVRFRR